MVATIEIELDERAAQAYTNAPPDAQEKLRALFNVWLLEFEETSVDLGRLMDQVSDRAVKRGLTPETLESLLNGE